MATSTRPPEPATERRIDVVQPSLPRSLILGVLIFAVAVGVGAYLVLDNWFALGVGVFVGYLIPIYLLSRTRESKRRATDRFVLRHVISHFGAPRTLRTAHPPAEFRVR